MDNGQIPADPSPPGDPPVGEPRAPQQAGILGAENPFLHTNIPTKETEMATDPSPRKPSEAPVILPADPLGAGLTVIDVEKAERTEEDDLKGPLGETTRKPYENEG